MSCVELEVASPIMVDAQIHRWTITNDNIYLLKFEEEPPQWLEDIIYGIIDDTGLVGDIDNLEDRFENFEEGYTEHFYDWQDGDKDTLAYVETIYNTNASFNAGIQEIKIAYVSHSESGAIWDSLIGAWQTGAGGAWFNERITVVSNVAYSAAKSASTLTATMKSQQDQLLSIVGDIDVLESQVDGKVETWTGYHPVIDANGDLIPTAEPYATWLANDEVIIHTGDTYILLEVNTTTGKDDIVASFNFVSDTVAGTYTWLLRTDDVATKAYEQAIEAGALADGKINSYYQTTPPTIIEDPTMGAGDLWVDSNDSNKLYRYSGTHWIAVRDTDITASVNRLDQATVDVSGVATAKSSLTVDADGYTTGIRLNATNNPADPGSDFVIFADKFSVAASDKQDYGSRPFTIDTNTRDIKFNGKVEFSNISGGETIVTKGTLTQDLARSTTVIDGSRIITGSINANVANIYNINANKITAGVIYNTGGNSGNYTMAISLDGGFIHIK